MGTKLLSPLFSPTTEDRTRPEQSELKSNCEETVKVYFAIQVLEDDGLLRLSTTTQQINQHHLSDCQQNRIFNDGPPTSNAGHLGFGSSAFRGLIPHPVRRRIHEELRQQCEV